MTRTAIVLGRTTRARRVPARSGFTYDARQHGRSKEVAQMLWARPGDENHKACGKRVRSSGGGCTNEGSEGTRDLGT